jgi:hypothetical protein
LSQYFRRHEVDHHRRPILLVVGIGLGVASVLQLGRIGAALTRKWQP